MAERSGVLFVLLGHSSNESYSVQLYVHLGKYISVDCFVHLIYELLDHCSNNSKIEHIFFCFYHCTIFWFHLVCSGALASNLNRGTIIVWEYTSFASNQPIKQHGEA